MQRNCCQSIKVRFQNCNHYILIRTETKFYDHLPLALFTTCICIIRKQRYVYGTILDNIAKVKGIIKFDLHAEPDADKTKLEVGGNVQGIYDLGPGRFGSEAVYVPRVPGITSEEDDGYLIFFVHDESTGYCFPPHKLSTENDFDSLMSLF